MAFIRNCFVTTALLLCILHTKAQVVYYPAGSSALMKATAGDVAMLLQKAISGSQFTTASYTIVPSKGVVLIYDSTVNISNCVVKSDGTSIITFRAAGDNAMVFGIYQYLASTTNTRVGSSAADIIAGSWIIMQLMAGIPILATMDTTGHYTSDAME